jgi:hypothetical protein
MNTLVTRTAQKVFRSTALFGLAALLVGAPAALAGNDGSEDPANELKAVAYATSSLKLKVNFENPAREKVTLLIFNEAGQVVYSTPLGQQEIYNGKLDLSSLADADGPHRRGAVITTPATSTFPYPSTSPSPEGFFCAHPAARAGVKIC